jgi:3-dehydroquinate synthase
VDRRFDFPGRAATTRIVVGPGVRTRLPELLRTLGASDVVVVHDTALAGLAAGLAAPLAARTLAVPAGEAAKDLRHVADAAEQLRRLGADRGTTLLGLGGGALTDFAGFLAAVWLRGVRFVACPTTTLAMSDAAIGGKNGVDLGGRKNELGAIRQPDLVVADIDWLSTLPDARWREGFVEAIKMAAVLDAAAFARLGALLLRLAARDAAAATTAIELAVAMKMAVVAVDEHERDLRRWLNFGHTIGHALESAADGALRHGECVAIGMLAECRAAGAPAVVTAAIEQALGALGAPTRCPPQFADPERLWRFAAMDKKARSGEVPMIVPFELGSGRLVPLTRDALARALS